MQKLWKHWARLIKDLLQNFSQLSEKRRVKTHQAAIIKPRPAASCFYYFLICGLTESVGLTGRVPLYWVGYITSFFIAFCFAFTGRLNHIMQAYTQIQCQHNEGSQKHNDQLEIVSGMLLFKPQLPDILMERLRLWRTAKDRRSINMTSCSSTQSQTGETSGMFF